MGRDCAAEENFPARHQATRLRNQQTATSWFKFLMTNVSGHTSACNDDACQCLKSFWGGTLICFSTLKTRSISPATILWGICDPPKEKVWGLRLVALLPHRHQYLGSYGVLRLKGRHSRECWSCACTEDEFGHSKASNRALNINSHTFVDDKVYAYPGYQTSFYIVQAESTMGDSVRRKNTLPSPDSLLVRSCWLLLEPLLRLLQFFNIAGGKHVSTFTLLWYLLGAARSRHNDGGLYNLPCFYNCNYGTMKMQNWARRECSI